MNDNHRLKIGIPDFEGSFNLDEFVDWLHSIEKVLEYKGYLDEKNYKVVILEFKDYVSLWWENVKKQRNREGKERVRTWEKLKKLLKK